MKARALLAETMLLASVLTAAAACAQTADTTFLVPRAQLLASVKTVGVMSVGFGSSTPTLGPLAGDLEQQIVARLQSNGFTVVPPSAEAEIRARASFNLKGLFDPMTGLPILERMDALNEFVTHEYRALHPVDATLRAMIVVRRAKFGWGVAEWDGVRERVSSEHGLTAVMQGVMSPGLGMQADAPALSLAVVVADASGKPLYEAHGGLLALKYPTLEGKFASYDLASIDTQLTSSLAARAVQVAIDPFATGTSPGKPLAFTLAPTVPAAGIVAPAPNLAAGHPRIALGTLALWNPALPQADRIKIRYHELLASRLRAAGFEVTASEAYDESWAAEAAAVGGFFNPLSGFPDTAKIAASRKHVLTALHEKYQVSALVLPSIEVSEAPFQQGVARWAGVREPVQDKQMGSTLLDGSLRVGTLRALTLRVSMFDAEDRTLFEGIGGIQLLDTMIGSRSVNVPEASLLQSPGNDEVAVTEALRGLAPAR